MSYKHDFVQWTDILPLRIYLWRRRHGKISHKVKKIVYWRLTYFLSVLIIGPNITCI